jgi:hypothetical protein
VRTVIHARTRVSPHDRMDFTTEIAFTRSMMFAQPAQPWEVCEGPLVVVQGEWNGWRTAVARLVDLEQVHWLQPKGAPRRLIHAYVPCTKLQSGDVAHECHERSAPHRLLVCILKCHTAHSIFEALSRAADDRERNLLSNA